MQKHNNYNLFKHNFLKHVILKNIYFVKAYITQNLLQYALIWCKLEYIERDQSILKGTAILKKQIPF